MSEITNCNQCHNACRLDEVKCGRGERYREYLQNGGKPEEYAPKNERHHEGERRGEGHRERGRHRH